MAFEDGLKDICTIQTISITEDSFGKEIDGYTNLYENIKCRLGKGQNKIIKSEKKEDNFVVIYKLYVSPQYNGAVESDRVVINSKNYKLYGGQPAKGGETNHIIYYIKEDVE